MEGMLGEITPGAVADFIVVDGNPLAGLIHDGGKMMQRV